MANSIALAKKYLPLLDEVYQVSSKTAILEAPAEFVRETANANQVLLPKITLDGLGTYDRNAGFTAGDADLVWQTHTFTQDRGRTFSIDDQDNDETLDVSIGAITSQFIRTKVVPEVDAYRFATLYSKAGTKVVADLSSSTVVTAIDVAKENLMEAEVDSGNIVLFVSPKVYTYLKNDAKLTRQFVGGSVNREIEFLDEMAIIPVPQSRFYTLVTMYDGKTAGQEVGGYIRYGSQYDAWSASHAYSLNDMIEESGRIYKVTTAGTSGSSKPTFPSSGTVTDGSTLVWTFQANSGRSLNFIMMDLGAGYSVTKTALPRIFDPMTNQVANAWKFDYRLYHDLFVLDNKVNGIYAHNATT